MSAEEKLFTWDSYDFVGDTTLVFYNATLRVDIGEHKAGSKFEGIMVDTENDRIVLQTFNEDGTLKDEFQYELSYKVGNKIG